VSRKRRPQGKELPAGAAGARPMVAIVGRPNVGKSTLFNRLAGQRIAIVEDIPGVTRDRHYADCWVLGHDYVLIDTGGFDPESDDPMQEGIARHVRLALDECDVVICVVDATTEPMPADREAMRLLRQADKPVIYVANKADTPAKSNEATSYYELGIDRLHNISALHGHGFGELSESLAAALPELGGPTLEIDEDTPRVAIIGRPNAGKSSLVNRLLGEDRQLVDDRPGTTVDTVDSLLEGEAGSFVLIDTAGIRRKRAMQKASTVETMSVFQAIRAMERADIVVVMIDANEGVGEQDAKIAGLAEDRGCAILLALNKTDLMSQDEQKQAMDRAREVLAFIPWAPMVTLSAKTGKGVNVLITRVADAVAEHRKRVPTGEINRFFEEVLATHPPPSMGGRGVRIYYVTQARSRPPTFVISCNDPERVHFSYQRFVVNQIRERFGFRGTPIRMRYRGKKDREDPT
jgi:GTP-binding protein